MADFFFPEIFLMSFDVERKTECLILDFKINCSSSMMLSMSFPITFFFFGTLIVHYILQKVGKLSCCKAALKP